MATGDQKVPTPLDVIANSTHFLNAYEEEVGDYMARRVLENLESAGYKIVPKSILTQLCTCRLVTDTLDYSNGP